mmetsp:Transcript_79448/g.257278  ORF Transcript_79448/g.257278 Transcript_79448/m.257278 type:complete len:180 (-) Transcript_79448:550-1089(-)
MHCDADTAMGCHMIENTLCHLIHNCNDPDARFSTCKYEIPRPEESDPVPQPELKWRQLLAASIGFVGNNTRTYAVCVLGVIAVVWLVLVALEMRRRKRTRTKMTRDRREAEGSAEKKACADIDSRRAVGGGGCCDKGMGPSFTRSRAQSTFAIHVQGALSVDRSTGRCVWPWDGCTGWI